jgi:hypothetical protein
MAIAVNRNIRATSEESFVETKPTAALAEDQLRLDILKHVINAKQVAADAAEKAAVTRERKRKLLDALERQQDAELADMSADDIRAELEAMS